MSSRARALGCTLAALLIPQFDAAARDGGAPDANAQADVAATKLPQIVVSAARLKPKPRRQERVVRTLPQPASVAVSPAVVQPIEDPTALVPPPPPLNRRYQLPQTTASVTAERVQQTVNVVDTSDAVKYMPSLFVRKRNAGDNQAVLATRSWGVSSSARTLIYADDILISTLLGNNNSNASPRWGMVSPEEIKRIDFLYGPFSAAYPGNSMGGVLNITTRMPEKPELHLKQTEAFQPFSFYNTHDTYRTDQTSASVGNRWGAFAAFVSVNYQNSFSQPLAWVTTSSSPPAGTTGTIIQPSRTGGVGNVLGAGGLLHTEQFSTKGKFTLDLTPWLTASYMVGFWSNDQKSRVETYLRDGAGQATYGGPTAGSGFASNTYNLAQQNIANALSLKTDTGGAFDWDVVVTRYDYLKDIQRNPFTVAASGANFTDVGRIARLDGTNWMTADAKGIWRADKLAGMHEVSFGVHGDLFELKNPTYRTDTWYGGADDSAVRYNDGRGKTQTSAVWAQDAWRFAPQFKLTLGGRLEWWRAFGGYNLSTTTNAATGAITSTSEMVQPPLGATRFSPKGSLSYEPNKDWLLTASVGVANRFPTVTELYQNATVAGVVVFPNANLAPERALATELAVERRFTDGKLRFSLFQDDTRDALISQNGVIPGTATPTAFVTNVDHVRVRGFEFAWLKADILIPRVEWFGSVTYADSRILSDPTFVGTNGSTAEGKRVPNVPLWRSTIGATYRPNDNWAWTVAGRYQSKTYATLDNTDNVQNVFQSFDPFFVVDTRVHLKATANASFEFGIDNLTNTKYHLFHPFPQRTYVVQGRVKF